MIYSQIWLNIAPTKLFQNYLFQSYSYKAREHHTSIQEAITILQQAAALG